MAIKSFTTGEVLTASDTNNFLANSGLVYVGGGNISGSATSFSDVFTSTYRNYKIFVTFDGGSDIATTLKLRTAGGDQTNNYYCGAWLVDSAGTANQSENNAAQFRFGYHYTNSGTSTSEITISNPQISTVNTGISGFGGHYYPVVPNARVMTFAGVHSLVQANTGFSILASGTTTGKVRIYGIREP